MNCRVFAACVLAVLTTGHAVRITQAGLRSADSGLLTPRTKGNTLFQSGRFGEAGQLYQRGYDQAICAGDRSSALRFLINLGGVRFALFEYRGALQAYSEARRLARQLGDTEMLAVISSNLSSLYLQQQEFNAGSSAAEEALTALEGAGPTRLGPLLRAQCAILHSRGGRFDVALPLFRQALAEAEAGGDVTTAGLVWDQLGYELMNRGRLEEAEQALLEAYRPRRLNRRKDVQYSYYTLGMLRLAQGDPISAQHLLDESIARLEQGAGTLELWRVYFQRGRARMQSGRMAEALADYQNALDLAGRLRLEVLPAESVWVNTGVDRSRLCSELIRTASALYLRSGDPAYAQMGFAVLEANRAAGLRALIQSPEEWRRRLPPQYWETLARLRSTEAALLRAEHASAESELSRLQYRLTAMEAEAGLNLGSIDAPRPGAAPQLVKRLRGSLRPGETFFSFHLDDPHSFLWVVTRERFRMFRLPPQRQISALAKEFREASRLGRQTGVPVGERLYSTLFGPVPADLLANPRWMLALDGDLFQLPLAALVTGREGGRPQYLAERHSVVMVPSAAMLERRDGPAWDGPFIGVGDPIYNSADPRRPASGDPLANRTFLGVLAPVLAAASAGQGIELARLAGSGREIEACSRAWRAASPGTVLLTGSRATIHGLEQALGRNPSILHFATHFLKSAGDAPQALIALSLSPGGALELLGPAEISRKRVNAGLVVLSGCTSAGARTLPSEGLMGMTRAWLAAGASSVLATLWPTPDDQGKLLVSFYSHLAELRANSGDWAVAEALRMAQLDALHSGSWQESPRYWGAYILAQKE
jgi:CHAT domain-containing protein/Tfp pilus assembly protein PilF